MTMDQDALKMMEFVRQGADNATNAVYIKNYSSEIWDMQFSGVHGKSQKTFEGQAQSLFHNGRNVFARRLAYEGVGKLKMKLEKDDEQYFESDFTFLFQLTDFRLFVDYDSLVTKRIYDFKVHFHPNCLVIMKSRPLREDYLEIVKMELNDVIERSVYLRLLAFFKIGYGYYGKNLQSLSLKN